MTGQEVVFTNPKEGPSRVSRGLLEGIGRGGLRTNWGKQKRGGTPPRFCYCPPSKLEEGDSAKLWQAPHEVFRWDLYAPSLPMRSRTATSRNCDCASS